VSAVSDSKIRSGGVHDHRIGLGDPDLVVPAGGRRRRLGDRLRGCDLTRRHRGGQALDGPRDRLAGIVRDVAGIGIVRLIDEHPELGRRVLDLLLDRSLEQFVALADVDVARGHLAARINGIGRKVERQAGEIRSTPDGRVLAAVAQLVGVLELDDRGVRHLDLGLRPELGAVDMQVLVCQGVPLVVQRKEAAGAIVEGPEPLVPDVHRADFILGHLELGEVVLAAGQRLAVDDQGGGLAKVLGDVQVLDADAHVARASGAVLKRGFIAGDGGGLAAHLDVAFVSGEGVGLGLVGGPDRAPGEEQHRAGDEAGANNRGEKRSFHGV
jgi:hypothetical protein